MPVLSTDGMGPELFKLKSAPTDEQLAAEIGRVADSVCLHDLSQRDSLVMTDDNTDQKSAGSPRTVACGCRPGLCRGDGPIGRGLDPMESGMGAAPEDIQYVRIFAFLASDSRPRFEFF